MSDLTLSKAIRQATVFLEQVHEDVRSLLVELVAMMDRAGWRSVYDGRIDWYLGPKLVGGWRWIIPDAWLLFVPTVSSEKNADRLIAVSCNFAHLEGTTHEYATFAASVARFSIPVSAVDVWDDWEPTPDVYKACLGTDQLMTLPLNHFSSWAKHTANVATIILPLSDLTSADVLRTKVIEPIFAAEKKLGAKK